jgi:hypothetical protein
MSAGGWCVWLVATLDALTLHGYPRLMGSTCMDVVAHNLLCCNRTHTVGDAVNGAMLTQHVLSSTTGSRRATDREATPSHDGARWSGGGEEGGVCCPLRLIVRALCLFGLRLECARLIAL